MLQTTSELEGMVYEGQYYKVQVRLEKLPGQDQDGRRDQEPDKPRRKSSGK